ncbi:MAG: response regulator, partial [Chloroflexi bacterium]|nr:response regulator [Chloroflexota bacterium]
VDDEKDILELLISVFECNYEYKVISASDGREAIALAHTYVPDIIVLDIQLPGLNGYDVCRLIKSDPVISPSKVLLVSGMPKNAGRLRALEVNADEYIAKPFNPTDLLSTVEKLLNHRPKNTGDI